MEDWKLAARLFRILWIGFLLTNLELISLRCQGCLQLNYLKNGKLKVDNKLLPSRNVGYTGTANPARKSEPCWRQFAKLQFQQLRIHRIDITLLQNTFVGPDMCPERVQLWSEVDISCRQLETSFPKLFDIRGKGVDEGTVCSNSSSLQL